MRTSTAHTNENNVIKIKLDFFFICELFWSQRCNLVLKLINEYELYIYYLFL